MSSPKIVPPVSAASESTERAASSGLDEAIQGVLGRKLRESYEEIVKEKVPDKLLQLLDDLKRSEAGKAIKVRES